MIEDEFLPAEPRGTFLGHVNVVVLTYALDGGVPGSLGGAAAWTIGLLAIFISLCVWRYRRMN